MPTRRFHDNATPAILSFASWVPGTRDVEAYLVAASRDGREGSCWKLTVAPVALKRHSHSVGGHGMELRTGIAGSATQATSDVLGSRTAGESPWGRWKVAREPSSLVVAAQVCRLRISKRAPRTWLAVR